MFGLRFLSFWIQLERLSGLSHAGYMHVKDITHSSHTLLGVSDTESLKQFGFASIELLVIAMCLPVSKTVMIAI